VKLYTYCPHCKEENSFFSSERDRLSLAQKQGEIIKNQCKNCSGNYQFHVNKIFAKESKISIVVSLIILIGGSIFAIKYVTKLFNENPDVPPYEIFGLFAILIIPFGIYLTIVGEEWKRIRNFNSFRI